MILCLFRGGTTALDAHGVRRRLAAVQQQPFFDNRAQPHGDEGSSLARSPQHARATPPAQAARPAANALSVLSHICTLALAAAGESVIKSSVTLRAQVDCIAYPRESRPTRGLMFEGGDSPVGLAESRHWLLPALDTFRTSTVSSIRPREGCEVTSWVSTDTHFLASGAPPQVT
jgi:hypothetical protein